MKLNRQLFIDGKEVTEDQAREIILNAGDSEVVVKGYTEYTSSVDGITYGREFEQVYQGKQLVSRW